MKGFLDAPSPRWFTIAAHRPFLTDLAAGLWRELSPLGTEALSQAVILLPNRRTVRDLTAAFMDFAGGGALMPPQMRALGDLDEGEPPFEPGEAAFALPPAIGAARRRFELTGLVVANQDLLERRLDARSALDLADALAAFLDSMAIEEAGEAVDVDALAQGDLAQHWRRTADFLKLATVAWPRRLAELGVMDVAARRVALLRALHARWLDAPPSGILVAAGSTGSTPATADLLAAVAGAPRGLVVLPGLDTGLADEAWDEVGEEHPQGSLRRLLDRAGVARGDVKAWSPAQVGPSRWRRRLINESLRPPRATADWLEVIAGLRAEGPFERGLEGLTIAAAPNEEVAAGLAALLMREALETDGRTAALITPDAALARRVSARLTRWNISADSSIGAPLAAAPAAILASLVARSQGPADPVSLLAILKHPLTRLGLAPESLDPAREPLERYGLRGPRPADWGALEARLNEAMSERPAPLAASLDLTAALRAALSGMDAVFADGDPTPAEATRALIETLDALAIGPDGEAGGVWSGQTGTALGLVLTQLLEESETLPPVTRSGFGELIDALLAGEVVRPGGASHPRLMILGVLEARLVRANLMILAGLEEGVWPAAAPIDPFLSRPMRAQLGLPAPERRIGLAAHDFAQAACAPEVVLLHSKRRAGSPSVESRWLWRLRTLIKGAGLALPERPQALDWARALDGPIGNPPASLKTAERPRPTPPVEVRPRRMPVTEVERWVRDPYAVYARRILGLRALDPPDAPVEALARGSAIHKAFERFVRAHPEALPADAVAVFEAMILEALDEAGMPGPAMTRERALARNLAPWVIEMEAARRPGATLHVEMNGEHVFETAAGPFTLTARADRLEVREGRADVIDFKTGRVPSTKMVEAHLSPQLTLTAAILAAGGFGTLGPLSAGELVYARISGGREPGALNVRGDPDPDELARQALEGLKRRVTWFEDPATAYVARAAPQFLDDAGDYDALARVWEWLVVGDAEAAE